MSWILSQFPDETVKIESIHLLFLNKKGAFDIFPINPG